MSPNVRRAFHQALDLVLDAIAEDARGESPKKGRRRRADSPPPDISGISAETREKAARAFERAGL